MTLRLSIVTVSSICLLSACGGSSAKMGSTPPPAASFAELQEEGTALGQVVAQIPYTEPSTLPSSGSANYDGALGIVLSDNSAAAGTMRMTADFGAGTVEGRVTDIFTNDEESLTGSLTIGSAAIDRTADITTEFTYNAPLTGRLVNTTNQNITVDARLEGDFTGPDYDYVEGFVDGEVDVDGATLLIVGGEFVGQKR